MNRQIPTRKRLAAQPLTVQSVASIFRATLPKRNNYKPPNYLELLEEFASFGIYRNGQLRKIMLRHRGDVIAADRGPFDPRSAAAFRAELGDAAFADFVRRQIFWTWEGLARRVMECEFGERYKQYLRQRYDA